ncbi:MAG: dephospho-CoA kinase [Myxococcales bacterium]|nr:dephospho-CoA kinase [Myxococcales bacterium]
MATGGTSGRIIGLTGGIASGKSTVGRLLRSLGAWVIDADEIARIVVEPGRPAYEKLVAAFGPEILQPPTTSSAGSAPAIDRKKLAARVFSDPQARATLNAITHPEIGKESAQRIQEGLHSGAPLVVYEATLLVENQSYLGFDGLLVVDIPEALQIERAIARGLPREQAEARLGAQTTRAARRAAANWILDNQGDEAALRAQVEALYPQLVSDEIPPRGR